jgi:hypothetical protein
MTRRRGLEAEIEALRAAGCERIYSVPVAAIQNNSSLPQGRRRPFGGTFSFASGAIVPPR